MTTPPLRFDHPKIKRLRRLIGRRSARADERALVAEGAKLAGEALAAGWVVESIYVPYRDSDARAAAEALTTAAENDPVVHQLATGVVERVAPTETPQPLLAVVGIRPVPDDFLATAEFVIVADGVADPGNLGTILRSAEAAGCDAVVVTPGTVDHASPKVVRASAGARFHVPAAQASLAEVRSAGLRTIGTSSHRGTPHTDADWSGRIAIVAGNEAHGLDAGDDVIDQWVRIEHHGRAESLNVAMATTLCCFEAVRWRR